MDKIALIATSENVHNANLVTHHNTIVMKMWNKICLVVSNIPPLLVWIVRNVKMVLFWSMSSVIEFPVISKIAITVLGLRYVVFVLKATLSIPKLTNVSHINRILIVQIIAFLVRILLVLNVWMDTDFMKDIVYANFRIVCNV